MLTILVLIIGGIWLCIDYDCRKMKKDSKDNNSYGKYDFSTKPYELLSKKYYFYTTIRKLDYQTRWEHFKYYNTLEGAKNAIKEHRKHSSHLDFRDSVLLSRFKIEKRNLATTKTK